MLSLSRRADYALLAMAELASSPGETLSARELSGRCGVPLPMLRNLLKALCRGGLLRSSIGAVGGYALAGPACGVSVLDVVEVIEGEVVLARCCDSREGERCVVEHDCRIRRAVQGVQRRILGILEQTSIEDLLAEGAGVAAASGRADGRPRRRSLAPAGGARVTISA